MQQLVFDIPPTDKYKLEDFIVSSCNKNAYDKITKWSTSWGVDPCKYSVLISGPSSCGKSFLSKIFSSLSQAYLINSHIGLASELEQRIIRDYPAFIIENIEAWAEKKLLYYFNLINENQKYLLLTSTKKTFDFTIPDLKSRINSITHIEVVSPDLELIKILLFKIFSTNSIQLESKVLEFLINRLPRKFDQIISAAQTIISYNLIYQRKITIPLIKIIFADRQMYLD